MKSGVFESGCEEGIFDSEEVSDDEEEEVQGKCFMATTSKYLITKKVRNLLISFNIPSSSYV